jgi:hypothetical protein
MSKQMNMNMKVAVESAYRRCAQDHLFELDEGKLAAYMSDKFGSAAAAAAAAATEKKEKKGKKSGGVGDSKGKAPGPFPWMGVNCAENCDAIRLNSGLYTQCTLKKKVDGKWCLACGKQAAKNASGKPDNGSLEDRDAVSAMAYVDPKGRKVVPYAIVLKKLKVTREMMDEYCVQNGMDMISDEHFVEPEVEVDAGDKKEKKEAKKKEKSADAVDKKKKGKKGKKGGDQEEEKVGGGGGAVPAVVAGEGGVVAEEEKKKGRPKKAKKEVTVSTSSTEDLFASLVQQQQHQSKQEKEEVKEEVKEEEKKKRGGGGGGSAAKKKTQEPAPVPVPVLTPVKRTATPIVPDEEKEKVKEVSPDNSDCGVALEQGQGEELQEEKEDADEDEDEDEDEEEDEVEPVTVGKKKYFRSKSSGVMYDTKTQEPIGVWNPKTKKIDALPEEDDNEEDGDE